MTSRSLRILENECQPLMKPEWSSENFWARMFSRRLTITSAMIFIISPRKTAFNISQSNKLVTLLNLLVRMKVSIDSKFYHESPCRRVATHQVSKEGIPLYSGWRKYQTVKEHDLRSQWPNTQLIGQRPWELSQKTKIVYLGEGVMNMWKKGE